jgi:hypothetical protein
VNQRLAEPDRLLDEAETVAAQSGAHGIQRWITALRDGRE